MPWSPEFTALMVVDLQEKLISALSSPLSQRLLIESVEIITKICHEIGVQRLIFFEQNPTKLGSYPSQFSDWIKIYPPVEKCYFSAIRGAEGMERGKALQKNNIKHVIVTGLETHICIFQTVQDLLALGYHVTVPIDATASIHKEDERAALRAMQAMGARVISLETLLFDLVGHYTSPVFNQLRKSLKGWRQTSLLSSKASKENE